MTDPKANIKWIDAETARKKAMASKDSALVKFLASVYSEINLACEMSKTYVTWRQVDHPNINFAAFVEQVKEILQKDGYTVYVVDADIPPAGVNYVYQNGTPTYGTGFLSIDWSANNETN